MTGLTTTISRNTDTEDTLKTSERSEEAGIGSSRKEKVCNVMTKNLVKLSPTVMLKAKLVSGEFAVYS